jgi:hypothetical protein
MMVAQVEDTITWWHYVMVAQVEDTRFTVDPVVAGKLPLPAPPPGLQLQQAIKSPLVTTAYTLADLQVG